MELKIISKVEEPMLSRTKVKTEIAFEKGTPSREEIRNRLAKDLGKEEKLVVVKGIYPEYGLKKAENISYAYENEEPLERIEPRTKKKTGEKKKEAEKEDTKAAAEEKGGKAESQKKEEPKEKGLEKETAAENK
ncbi:hypothetical protein KY347_03465 [Candidatus Woesearchaeota archaeon]|nr:hypothetical protein [Candidatus Woesearchaeota archaeon]